ncbi:hypothetical protein JCM10512_4892 [Bacteroides reticulotermitis JCM 10512]|uniref:Uncharacterized protein n=1 Tax=Bacteroides reticulotermitis JCM 10512 TaxID=1445607 RepID=W4V0Q6_9BACE|nr:hypothetical protein JCM10512_4892 [Bacteroides reticulotermitis JCM 10512]
MVYLNRLGKTEKKKNNANGQNEAKTQKGGYYRQKPVCVATFRPVPARSYRNS